MNDSIWAVIAGTAKAYNLAPDYVLYEMSYVNTLMYGSVLPSYDPDKAKKGRNGKNGQSQEVIKVDDPKNRERVRRIMEQFD